MPLLFVFAAVGIDAYAIVANVDVAYVVVVVAGNDVIVISIVAAAFDILVIKFKHL